MTSLSLYTLSDEVERLLSSEDAFDAETGELSPALVEALGDAKDKMVSVSAYILNMGAQLDAMSDHMKRIKARHDALAGRQEKLREYLVFNMKRTGVKEIAANDGTFSAKLLIERDASVEIFDEKQIPAAYMSKPVAPAPAPMKKDIAKAIKEGKDVPGAKITKKDRLELR